MSSTNMAYEQTDENNVKETGFSTHGCNFGENETCDRFWSGVADGRELIRYRDVGSSNVSGFSATLPCVMLDQE